MALWHISGDGVKRGRYQVATIVRQKDGRLTWRGLGMERINLTNEAEVLEDVKYFHRYGRKPTRLTFTSGRVIELP